ncbi:hypothetical protein KIH41_10435 [Litoribacter ruber]|uniref:Uncharacterized protein n=1 Tax=Litoribacter ruber TaxID=702568 RepID=A0AAP2CMC6_9BACT|nr:MULTISPECIES: hypothetical protein [Litoribacter]MBS9525210.1 hypothetical protein [Litoribacter alkaliphilus]MBT0811695.1 hypothetical protein [Litoribacter ruber]
MSVLPIQPHILENHWSSLQKTDVGILFKYIPLMESEFERAKKMSRITVGLNQELLCDFNDLAWELYKDLAFLGLVTCAEFDQGEITVEACELDAISKPDPMVCFRLLATAVQGRSFESGHFKFLIKIQVVLAILKGLRRAFDGE